MKIFTSDFLEGLIALADASPRRRRHHNVHKSHEDPCQRLFNAIEPDSYIRPHRHSAHPVDELMIAVRGTMALLTFNDLGSVVDIIRLGTEKCGLGSAVGAQISADVWHTVIALDRACILLEVKAGPFDSRRAKDLAPWAPEEGSSAAINYLDKLAALATD